MFERQASHKGVFKLCSACAMNAKLEHRVSRVPPTTTSRSYSLHHLGTSMGSGAITLHCVGTSGVKQLVLSIGQSASMQTGDTGDLDSFVILRWTSTMEIDVSIVVAYLFVTDTTRICGNFSFKQLFLWSAILFSYIIY